MLRHRNRFLPRVRRRYFFVGDKRQIRLSSQAIVGRPKVVVRNKSGDGAGDVVWDRRTLFLQLAKRSIRGLISGISKTAVYFLVISTLALSVESFLKNSVYFLLQQNSILVVSVITIISFPCLIILLWERAPKSREQYIFRNVNKQHNGLLSLFRYTFSAMFKFFSIEIAFRERRICCFLLIYRLIVNPRKICYKRTSGLIES